MSRIDNPEPSACLICSETIRSASPLTLEDGKFNYCDHLIHSVEDTNNSVISIKKQENGKHSVEASMSNNNSIKHGRKSFLGLCHLYTYSWQRRKRRTFHTKLKQDCFNILVRFLYALPFLVLNCAFITPTNAIEPSSPSVKSVSSFTVSYNPSNVPKARHLVLSSGEYDAKAIHQAEANMYLDTPSQFEGHSSRSRKQRGNLIRSPDQYNFFQDDQMIISSVSSITIGFETTNDLQIIEY